MPSDGAVISCVCACYAGRLTSLVVDDSYLPMHVRYAAQIAHGTLMVLAFCVFMPAGVVVARHKWLFTHTEVRLRPDSAPESHTQDPKLKPVWHV